MHHADSHPPCHRHPVMASATSLVKNRIVQGICARDNSQRMGYIIYFTLVDLFHHALRERKSVINRVQAEQLPHLNGSASGTPTIGLHTNCPATVDIHECAYRHCTQTAQCCCGNPTERHSGLYETEPTSTQSRLATTLTPGLFCIIKGTKQRN